MSIADSVSILFSCFFSLILVFFFFTQLPLSLSPTRERVNVPFPQSCVGERSAGGGGGGGGRRGGQVKVQTGRPRAICGQRYPLPCFERLWIGVRGSRAAAPKGTKSCRTQGDFCLSVHSSVRPSVPPGPLRPEICPLRPEIYPLRAENCHLRPWIFEGQLRARKDRFEAWGQISGLHRL